MEIPGNTPFGSSREPRLWSVAPFPQEFLLIIWSLGQDSGEKQDRPVLGPVEAQSSERPIGPCN